jgi:hypothetical protein
MGYHESMAIDTSKIDEVMRQTQQQHELKMKRFADLKVMLSDPDAVELMKTMLGSNGATANHEPPSGELVPEAGTQIGVIRKAIAQQAGSFTVSSLGNKLRAEGMDIDNIAVGRVLQRLNKKYHEIELVAASSGGNVPNSYTKTDRLRNG